MVQWQAVLVFGESSETMTFTRSTKAAARVALDFTVNLLRSKGTRIVEKHIDRLA